MRSLVTGVMVLAVVGGCSKKASNRDQGPSAQTGSSGSSGAPGSSAPSVPPGSPRFTGDMPVMLGDCAEPTVAFVAGPRPGGNAVRDVYGVDPPRPDDSADESGGTGGAMALDEGAMGKLDREPKAGKPPGSDNPLASEVAALADCFRDVPAHYGVAVIDLAYDSAGKVTSAQVQGVEGAPVAACVATAAKRVTRPASTTLAAQRCPLAFGVMPVAALPTIALTTTPAVIPAVSPPPAGAALAPHLPFVLAPLPATPMKLVNDAAVAIVQGGNDFLLATQDGAGWKLGAPLTLPIVPVPLGTGGHWHRVKPRLPDGVVDEQVRLAIWITREKMTVGMSRIKDFTEIAAGPDQRSKLATTLQEAKRTAFFADRTDLEIAADGDVPYADFTAAIDAAVAAGFVDWQQTTGDQLAVRP